jgi:hypothetical protein
MSRILKKAKSEKKNNDTQYSIGEYDGNEKQPASNRYSAYFS